MFWTIYFIIGAVLMAYSGAKQWERDNEYIKSHLALWLVVGIGCAILWPVLVAWAMYDAIQELIQEGEL